MKKKLIENIVKILDEKKAENIQVFDMRDKNYFVDDVIIATSMGNRHGMALLDYIKEILREDGEKVNHVDGSDDWVVLDTGDTLIHLMSQEYRNRYNLEDFLSQRDMSRGENRD